MTIGSVAAKDVWCVHAFAAVSVCVCVRACVRVCGMANSHACVRTAEIHIGDTQGEIS